MKKNNKNQIIVFGVFVLAILVICVFSFQRSKENKISEENYDPSEIIPPITLTAVKTGTTSENYQEFYFDPFDSGEPSTSSYLQLTNIRKSNIMLDADSSIIPDISLKYIDPSQEESSQGIEKYSYGKDVYKLKPIGEANTQGCREQAVYQNDKLLFSDLMCGSPLGTVIDWRMVSGKLALSYNKECGIDCETEVYYDGKLISKEYAVRNPRYLFSFGGKIGFVTSENRKEAIKTKIGINSEDRIYWNGKYITPFFDTIQTTSCCSNAGELKPTVFENGTLLFFGEKDNEKYLTEVKLN